MKNGNMLRYTVLIRWNQEVPGCSVIVPELPGCFSQGYTVEEALANAKEAIECHLEAIVDNGEELSVERQPFFVASIAVEPPSIQRTELDKLLDRLRADISDQSGCRIQAKALDTKGYNLGAPKIFAHVWKRSLKGHLEVMTRKEWADKAEVFSLADKVSDNGYFNRAACHWYVKGAQTDSYGRAVRALSKICVVRQKLGHWAPPNYRENRD